MRSTRSARHTPMKPLALAMAVFALALTVGLLHAAPAKASTAGWDVRWVRSPAAIGSMERLSADAGRVAYLTGSGTVVLFDVETNTATTLTAPGVAAGAPAIEGDYVVWSTFSEASGQGLFLHDLPTSETHKIASGYIYGYPILEGGRILWTGGTNDRLVLNLYDIATGTNVALNEGTPGQNHPRLLNDRWAVWREHQSNGRDVLNAYDIGASVKHVFPEVPEMTDRRMYALIGDQVVLSLQSVLGAPMVGLALLNLRQGTFTEISAAGNGSIADVAADEAAGRLSWTGSDSQGVYAAVYDLASQTVERVPTPYYSLGPIAIAGDMVLFRGQAREGIFTDAPMVLFAYGVRDHTLTDLGPLTPADPPFCTDGARAYWINQVLTNGSPRLAPHWSGDLIVWPGSSAHLFVATPPATAPAPFADVSGSDHYRTAIVSLFDRGVVTGYQTAGATTFLTDQSCLRAQFAKMMVVALGLPVDESLQAPFWDLGPDDPNSLYPHDYIAAAFKAGLTKGYPQGTFRPWEPISRAQLVTLLVRAASVLRPGMLLAPSKGYSSLLGDFDPTHGHDLAVAQYNGLVDGLVGYGRGWNPWLPATRGEGAQMLWNLLRIDLGP